MNKEVGKQRSGEKDRYRYASSTGTDEIHFEKGLQWKIMSRFSSEILLIRVQMNNSFKATLLRPTSHMVWR